MKRGIGGAVYAANKLAELSQNKANLFSRSGGGSGTYRIHPLSGDSVWPPQECPGVCRGASAGLCAPLPAGAVPLLRVSPRRPPQRLGGGCLSHSTGKAQALRRSPGGASLPGGCVLPGDGNRLRSFGARRPSAGHVLFPHPSGQHAEYPGGRGFGSADRRAAGPVLQAPARLWTAGTAGILDAPCLGSGAGHSQRQLSHKHLARQGPVQLGAASQHHLEHRLSVRHLLRGLAVGFGGPVAVSSADGAGVAASSGQRTPHRWERVSGLLGWVSSSFCPRGQPDRPHSLPHQRVPGG